MLVNSVKKRANTGSAGEFQELKMKIKKTKLYIYIYKKGDP